MRLARKDSKSCTVPWRPLIKDFSDLAKACFCISPNWNFLSIAVSTVLRLVSYDLSTTFVGGDLKFSTDRFLLRYSVLSPRDPDHHLQCKFSLIMFSCRLGKFAALWAW